MKKILLAILILLFAHQFCLAEEEAVNNIFTNDPQTQTELHGYLQYDEVPDETIYLEETPIEPINSIQLKEPEVKNNLNLKAPQKVGSKSLIPTKIKQMPALNVKTVDFVSKFSSPEYNFAPVSSYYSMESGKMSFGTTYDKGMSKAQQNYSTGVFARYDGKHFAITSAISKNASGRYDETSDSLYFAPELKITKRLSLLDAIESDVSQTNKSNEIILRYKPHWKKYADDVQFEVGAGQNFREDNYINSTVRFSTRFKL